MDDGEQRGVERRQIQRPNGLRTKSDHTTHLANGYMHRLELNAGKHNDTSAYVQILTTQPVLQLTTRTI